MTFYDLQYVYDDQAGYSRKKQGRGFSYYNSKGKHIKDEKQLKRIKELVIPPMWKDVWIAPKANAHIQATGYDEKGRKQYIYHPKWTEYQQQQKFDSLKAFGEALPSIRKQYEKHLHLAEWTEEKVLALVVALLDEAYLRIGSKQYENSNGTYGLSNLRRKHVQIDESCVLFSYKAKSNKLREVNIANRELCQLVRECYDLPGYELFRYQNGDKKGKAVDAADVNEYLRELSGEDYTAKTFRTWGGSVLAIEHYDEAVKEVEEHPQRKLTNAVVKRVAADLGNTEAICRDYYIHPKVLLSVEREEVPEIRKKSRIKALSDAEYSLLKLIS